MFISHLPVILAFGRDRLDPQVVFAQFPDLQVRGKDGRINNDRIARIQHVGIVQFLENIDHRCRAALRWENINILCHLNILEADLLQVLLQDLFSIS